MLQFVRHNLDKLEVKPVLPALQPSIKSFDELRLEQVGQIADYALLKRSVFLINQKPARPELAGGSPPVIAVFCQPNQEMPHHKPAPYVAASYCQWIESTGALCVPLPFDYTQASIQKIITSTNGLLVPGGSSNLWKSYERKEGVGPVMQGFRKVWRFLSKLWAKGVHYPVWGTCLGLQMVLLAITGEDKTLNQLDSKYHSMSFYSDYQNSAVLKALPGWMRTHLETEPAMNFNHRHGLSLKRYLSSEKYKEIRQELKLISVARDKSGEWFCAYLEGRNLPVFLSQFHPEKQQFQEGVLFPGAINKSGHSSLVCQFIATQFVNQCRRNKHGFQSREERNRYLIHNWEAVFQHDKFFQVYFISQQYRKKKDKDKKRSTVSIK